uniref:CSON011620 protein n=1 Tax=Culicoides sonorensis TaxID=179676 RepID=A0A336LGH1_CULSO
MQNVDSTSDMHRYMSDTYLGQAHLAPQPYPDVTHNTNPMIGYNVPADFGDYHGMTQRFKMMRLVTAPPPYPVNRLSSTSTPDLHALYGYRNSGPYNVSGSSPDLVSSRTFISNASKQIIESDCQLANCPSSYPTLAKATSNPIHMVTSIPSSNSNSTATLSDQQIISNSTMKLSMLQNASSSSSSNMELTSAADSGIISSNSLSVSSSHNINNNNNTSSIAKDQLNRSQSTTILESSQSSSYTIDSNTTRTTTDSGVSFANNTTSSTKEKKKSSIWNLLGRNKSSEKDKDKQKSATLGRDKSRDAKKGMSRDQDQMKHRWSTGTSKLQPLPTTLSKEKLCQLLEMKLADPELFYEFEGIPKHRENARYDCALQQENKQKNLDPNFLPYDDNRVRLTPSRENRLGYVNASPTAATVTSFWQGVWEADVYLVVQLTDDFQYVPSNGDRCLEYGQYQVWREYSQQSDVCTTSKLRVYHTQSRRYRSVWHLLYNNWGDQNCPKDVSHFLPFIEELGSIRLESVKEVPTGHNTNPPVLMHCSDGAARSGITVAADLFLYIVDHNQELDIPRVICQLRHQRGNFIPLFDLYKFIYMLLIHYLKQTRLI